MRRFLLIAFSTLMAFSNPPANAAYNPTKPIVTQCSANPTSIPDTGGQLQVTVHVVDPTPISFVVVNVINSSSNSIAFGGLSLQSGSLTDGDWSNTFTVKPNLKPGLYSVMVQNVMDTSDNSLVFYYCPNLKVNYGNAQESTPAVPAVTPKSTPTPKPSVLDKPTQGSDGAADVLNLRSQVALLQSQLRSMEAKIKKICAAKPRPKGC
jgi:hypothetical protein